MIGALWILSGVWNLLGVLFLFSIILIFVGLGIIRRQWLALTFAKFASIAMCIYASYLLIATPAFAQAGRELPVSLPLGLLVTAAFQAYIFWSVSD